MHRIITIAIINVLLFITSSFLANAQGCKDCPNALLKDMKISEEQLYLYAAVFDSGDDKQAESKEEGGIINDDRIRVINLGPIVNWKGLDYAPTVSADGKTLFFVSDREGSKLTNNDEESHDFWAAKKNDRLDTIFFTPYNIDTTTTFGEQGVNTYKNEGAASIAADKQSLYFTGCNRPDGLGDCDLYRTVIEGDKWGRPTNLGQNVNSKVWDSQPSIAPDQSRIYFASNRPDENGNTDMDIWYADWDFDNEEWKPAVNLKELNTPGKDITPFIAADNSTLFFASNGYPNTVGGLDFYMSVYDSETKTWSKPTNLGKPINTEDDEMFITLPASGDIIYFSSKREDLKGYQGNLDIFMAFVPTFFRAINVRVKVVDECSGENIPAEVTITNPLTNRVEVDSLTIYKTEMEMVVSNTDYGNPKDSLKFVDLQISAVNPKYGKTQTVQRVNKPSVTKKSEEAGSIADEIEVKLTLGQRPVIGSIINEADYVTRTKKFKPELNGFIGLVMEQVKTWDLYPLLNYVFFDLGKSDIPKRYQLFKSPDQKKMFTDTSIAGGTLDKYYHILNIYGFRLNQFPDVKIEIVGCNDGTTAEEKRPGLSKERATNVYNYLKDIWGISESRMKLTFKDKPTVVSNLKDSLGIQENRRVEILCSDWEVMKPVFDKDPKTFPQPETMKFTMKNGIEDQIVVKRRIEITRGGKPWKVLTDVGTIDPEVTWDWMNEDDRYPKDEVAYSAKLVVTTKTGAECESNPITIPVMQVTTEQKKVIVGSDSTLERYNLILFPFDRADAGPINEKIMRDYVYDRVLATSAVEVIGHTDVVGLYDHNQKLSDKRSNTVEAGIKDKTKGAFAKLNKRGVGEDEPLYTNDLPEGRFYNRTVQVIIRTPVESWENK